MQTHSVILSPTRKVFQDLRSDNFCLYIPRCHPPPFPPRRANPQVHSPGKQSEACRSERAKVTQARSSMDQQSGHGGQGPRTHQRPFRPSGVREAPLASWNPQPGQCLSSRGCERLSEQHTCLPETASGSEGSSQVLAPRSSRQPHTLHAQMSRIVPMPSCHVSLY